MDIHDFLIYGILPLLGLAMVLIFIRFLMGPSLPDRIISLDLLITTSLGIIVVYSVITNQPTLLDIGMILALIAFLGTLAFTYYLKKQTEKDD